MTERTRASPTRVLRTSGPPGFALRPWMPLLAMVAAGLLLRATVIALYSPSVLTYYGGDSTGTCAST